jgi:hypothetical protein
MNRHGEHDVVGDHDLVLAVREGGVEQPERADDAFDLARQATALQPDAVADTKRARTEQYQPGEEVAECLLGGKTQDDRGEGPADGERPRIQTGHAQRHQHRDDDREEPHDEPDGAGGTWVHAPKERRSRGTPKVASELPAQRDEREHRGDAHRLVDAEEALAVGIEDQNAGDHRQQHQRLDPRALDGTGAELPGQASLSP